MRACFQKSTYKQEKEERGVNQPFSLQYHIRQMITGYR
uniref:Uncharacterized protein n=1 Tax=Arundo donax TaxID=35708 RepID=A0A0A9EHJ6_ARUDO